VQWVQHPVWLHGEFKDSVLQLFYGKCREPTAICGVDFIIAPSVFVRPAFIAMRNQARTPWTISESNHTRRSV
jgi:hypothetical protein